MKPAAGQPDALERAFVASLRARGTHTSRFVLRPAGWAFEALRAPGSDPAPAIQGSLDLRAAMAAVVRALAPGLEPTGAPGPEPEPGHWAWLAGEIGHARHACAWVFLDPRRDEFEVSAFLDSRGLYRYASGPDFQTMLARLRDASSQQPKGLDP